MKFSAEFPSGAPGIGLLMLRAASVLLLLGPLFPPHRLISLIGGGLTILTVFLALGAFTRLAAGMSAIAITVVGARLGEHLSPLVASHAAMSLGLALLGPGAYSLDARVFGRRIIDLGPDRGP